MENREIISQRLSQLRAESGLTQNQLAEKMHSTRSSVSNYERGKTVPLRDLSFYCDYFDVTADWIMGRTNIRKPDMEPLTQLIYTATDSCVDLGAPAFTVSHVRALSQAVLNYCRKPAAGVLPVEVMNKNMTTWISLLNLLAEDPSTDAALEKINEITSNSLELSKIPVSLLRAR